MSQHEQVDDELETNIVRPKEGQSSRFQIVRPLGTGGMGEVHLAEDLSLRRNVAIKSIRTQLCQDPDVVKRIERECLLHAKIGTHPHIVTLYDRIEDDGRIQLIMEYVEGETLYSLLDRLAKEQKRLSLTQGIAIAVQTLEALARIHAHGIIHRDIKPANIMIARDDCGEYCAKLMDFGIARADDDGMTALTQTGMGGPGTPLYMAPEQIDPKIFGALSPATDVYAMGIMLYQIISGGPPFTGSITEIFNGHLNARPLRLDAKADPSVPAAVADIIDRALAKRQENRYPSAAAFREALLSVNTDMAGATGASHRAPAFTPVEPAGAPATLAAHEAAQFASGSPGETMLHGGKRVRSGSDFKIAVVLFAMVAAAIATVSGAGYWLYTRSGDDAAATATAAEPALPAGESAPSASPGATAAAGAPDSPTAGVSVSGTVAVSNPSNVDLQDLVPHQGAVAPADLPPGAPAGTVPDLPAAPMPSASQPPAFTNSGEKAMDVFEEMRAQRLAEQGNAEPAPQDIVPAAAEPPAEPPAPPAAAAPAPAPKAAAPKSTKPKASAPPSAASSLVADTPKPAPDPPAPAPAAEPAEPAKPAGGGFSVVGKEEKHIKN